MAAAPGGQVGEVGLVKPGWGAGDEPGGRSGANADQSIARAAPGYRSCPASSVRRRCLVLDRSTPCRDAAPLPWRSLSTRVWWAGEYPEQLCRSRNASQASPDACFGACLSTATARGSRRTTKRTSFSISSPRCLLPYSSRSAASMASPLTLARPPTSSPSPSPSPEPLVSPAPLQASIFGLVSSNSNRLTFRFVNRFEHLLSRRLSAVDLR
jgi:hypothetical protein